LNTDWTKKNEDDENGVGDYNAGMKALLMQCRSNQRTGPI